MNKQAQEEKHQLMTTAPVEKLVLKMALPSMISMMISSIYNMVDTLYVGRLSTQAAGAVGVVFSYMSLIQAFAFFFGHGSANFISRSLGAKNTDGAAKMAATGFFSCFIAGLFFMSTGLIFMDPLLFLLYPPRNPVHNDFFCHEQPDEASGQRPYEYDRNVRGSDT
jgi:Na+-driven multidrug efflux pump